MFTDVSLHCVFTDLGGVTAVMDLLTSAVRIPDKDDSVVQRVSFKLIHGTSPGL